MLGQRALGRELSAVEQDITYEQAALALGLVASCRLACVQARSLALALLRLHL